MVKAGGTAGWFVVSRIMGLPWSFQSEVAASTLLIALVLIWLAISLVRMGYENIRAARAAVTARATSGTPPTRAMFLPGTPFEPPLARMIAPTRMDLSLRRRGVHPRAKTMLEHAPVELGGSGTARRGVSGDRRVHRMTHLSG